MSLVPTLDTNLIRLPSCIFTPSTFGDSFTHCNDVANAETWQRAMEDQNSKLEVLNFGMGGFGLFHVCHQTLLLAVAYDQHLNPLANPQQSHEVAHIRGATDRPAVDLNNNITRLQAGLVGRRFGNPSTMAGRAERLVLLLFNSCNSSSLH